MIAEISNQQLRDQLRSRARAGTPGWHALVRPTGEVVIVACELVPNAALADPRLSRFGPPPHDVNVAFSDGTQATLLTYYADELHFTSQEFIGLTARQAHDLFLARDQAYLRS